MMFFLFGWGWGTEQRALLGARPFLSTNSRLLFSLFFGFFFFGASTGTALNKKKSEIPSDAASEKGGQSRGRLTYVDARPMYVGETFPTQARYVVRCNKKTRPVSLSHESSVGGRLLERKGWRTFSFPKKQTTTSTLGTRVNKSVVDFTGISLSSSSHSSCMYVGRTKHYSTK